MLKASWNEMEQRVKIVLPSVASSSLTLWLLHSFLLLRFIQVRFGRRNLHQCLVFHARHRLCMVIGKRQKSLQDLLLCQVRVEGWFSTGTFPSLELFCCQHSVEQQAQKAAEPSNVSAVRLQRYLSSRGHAVSWGCFWGLDSELFLSNGLW